MHPWQLRVAKLNLSEIFFDLPVEEKMAYIAHSRVLRQQRKLRKSNIPRPHTPSLRPSTGTTVLAAPSAVPSMSNTRGRLSSATLRAIERRQREKEMHTSMITSQTSTVKSESKSFEKSLVKPVAKVDRRVPAVKSGSKNLDRSLAKPDKPVSKVDRQVPNSSVRKPGGGGRAKVAGRGGEVRLATRSTHSVRVRGKENQQTHAKRFGLSRSAAKQTHTK